MRTRFLALLLVLMFGVLLPKKNEAQVIVLQGITCNGDSSGQLIAVPNYGKPPYSYLWSTGDTTAQINNLLAGVYSVTVTDSLSVDSVTTINLLNPLPVTVVIDSQTNVTCFGGNNGSVKVTGTGFGSISYLWSTGEITPTINNLFAGNYTVTVTDGHGCTTSTSITINQPAALAITPLINSSTCDGIENGSIVSNPTGGTLPYSFNWREITTDSIYVTQNLNNIRGGNYSVIITDINNCIFTDTVFVLSLVTVPITTTVDWYVCNGFTGAVNIQADNADSAQYYTYSWNSVFNTDSVTTNDSVFNASTSFIAGSYLITTTELATGCANYFAFTIEQSASPLVVSYTKQDNLCHEDNLGSIQLSVSGGDPLPAYQVTWTGPNGFSSSAFSIAGLEVGNYVYTVTDDSACSFSETVQIGPLTPLQVSIVSTNVSCNGLATGTAQVSLNAGLGFSDFLWNTGATTQNISGLIAGNYSVTVTDSVGCIKTANVTITQPNAINIILDSMNDVSCNGYNDGNISLTTFGGTGNLNYSWSQNSMASYTTEDLTNVTAGIWKLIVTDANGCSVDTTVTINQPPATSFEDSIHSVSCNNGSDGFWEIIISSGIFSPYVAIFSNGDTIQSDTAALAISNLPAGNYSAVVYASNGCSWSFLKNFDQPLPLTVSVANSVNVICKNGNTGSILLDEVHGGTSPYTYLWSNGMNTNPITGLPAGIYTVTITDFFGCTIEESREISEPYNAMKFFPTITTTSCQQAEDGQVFVNEWDVYDSPYLNYFMLFDSVGNLIDSVSMEEIIGNLEPGTYTGIVMNNVGCFATDSNIVVEQKPEDCILIPNLVTPNDDGYNDVFKVEGGCNYDSFYLDLFTDQGEKVFSSESCDFVWDPKSRDALPNTVYFYYIKITENGKTYEFKSSLNINY
jgi:gliding motility-associated-like protein